MSVTDETYVSAYRGIIAAKGDSFNTINEIGGNLTAGSLYNILGYDVGVLKNILNEFDYEVNGTTVTIKNGQAICYGYVGRLTSAIDFTLVAPSSSDKYYFIVADFDLKTSTVADFSIGLFNNNNSDSYTPTYLDNLNENETGRYQYKLYMIKIDTSSVITVTDLRDIKETVKNAENANFDKIISTQTEFEALIASPTWLSAKSVLFNGNNGAFTLSTIDNSGIKIPLTVYTIKGINNATITITNFLYNETTANSGLWYETLQTNDEYSIDNLTLNVNGNVAYGFNHCYKLANCISNSNGTSTGIGFSTCNKLINCTSTGNGATNGIGFNNCDILTNCTGNNTVSGSNYSYGFYSCNQLINCTGNGVKQGFSHCNQLTSCTGNGVLGFSVCKILTNCTGNSTERGFSVCNQLINCTGIGTSSTSTGCGFYMCHQLLNCIGTGNSVDAVAYGFYTCYMLTNCMGTGISTNNTGYGFSNDCEYASCCKSNPYTSSTTAIWEGIITKRDDDSCET